MAVTHVHPPSRHRHNVMDGVELNPEDNVLFGPSTQNKIERWDIIKSMLSVPCVGNVDFQDIIKMDSDGVIKDKDAEVIGIVQSFDGSSIGDLNTIRSSDPNSPENISQISLSIESEN